MLTTAHLLQTAADVLAAAPSPSPTEVAPVPGVSVDTAPLAKFLITQVAPILVLVVALIFVGRARKGEVGKVVTSSGILVVAAVVAGMAGTLMFAGDFFVDLIIKQ